MGRVVMQFLCCYMTDLLPQGDGFGISAGEVSPSISTRLQIKLDTDNFKL
jgi:hypothetical protein